MGLPCGSPSLAITHYPLPTMTDTNRNPVDQLYNQLNEVRTAEEVETITQAIRAYYQARYGNSTTRASGR
jgi:hypothetical protein